MPGDFLVIGLGQFGLGVARELSQRGAEVIAVDKNEGPVNSISSYVARALVMDATDEESMAALEPSTMDAAICGIGVESKDANIMVTTLLKEYGAKRIVSRQIGQLHGRILRRVGADEIVNPESEVARHVAQRVLIPSLDQLYDLGDGIVMAELPIPKTFVGKTLEELDIFGRFRVTVVAVRRSAGEAVLMVPTPSMNLEGAHQLVVVGAQRDIEFLSRPSE